MGNVHPRHERHIRQVLRIYMVLYARYGGSSAVEASPDERQVVVVKQKSELHMQPVYVSICAKISVPFES